MRQNGHNKKVTFLTYAEKVNKNGTDTKQIEEPQVTCMMATISKGLRLT